VTRRRGDAPVLSGSHPAPTPHGIATSTARPPHPRGCGLVQARGGPLIEVGPGDTIDTPPGEWHWHGAAPGHFITHLALSLDAADDQTGPATEWGDHLSADEYAGYRPPSTTKIEENHD
jgi:hypothetical protein